MLHFKIVNKRVVAIDTGVRNGTYWFNCSHFPDKPYAEMIAMSAMALTTRVYIAVEYDLSALAKFDVIKLPTIEDVIWYKINNRWYDDGIVSTISNDSRYITTSTGAKYYRKNDTGIWLKDNNIVMKNMSI